MKQLTITFLFSIISIFCFAQTPFTEQIFLDFCKKMEKDPVQTLKNSAVSDYVFVGTGGFVTDLKGLIALYDNLDPAKFTPTNYKVRTYGNSAIVTGRLKHSYTNKKTGAPRILDELITYTFAWIGGEWKFTSGQHSDAPYDKIDDNPEEIVKQWLTEYNKDNVAFFMDRCTEDFVASNNGGKFFGKKVFDGRKSMPHNTEASDMKSFQSGNLAIVTGVITYHHKQPDGTDLTDKNVFTFGMVKKNGKWMYASHHFSSMVEEKPEAVLQEFLTEYHKNPKAFFESRLPEDFRYLTGGKQFETKEVVLSRSSANPTDSEVSDLKAFQNGNLGIISGVHIFKNRQADGNIQANKVAFTYTMVKKNGKWFFAESHHTPVKE